MKKRFIFILFFILTTLNIFCSEEVCFLGDKIIANPLEKFELIYDFDYIDSICIFNEVEQKYSFTLINIEEFKEEDEYFLLKNSNLTFLFPKDYFSLNETLNREQYNYTLSIGKEVLFERKLVYFQDKSKSLDEYNQLSQHCNLSIKKHGITQVRAPIDGTFLALENDFFGETTYDFSFHDENIFIELSGLKFINPLYTENTEVLKNTIVGIKDDQIHLKLVGNIQINFYDKFFQIHKPIIIYLIDDL